MQLTEGLKESISAAIMKDFAHKQFLDSEYNQTRHAIFLGVDASIHSRLLSGVTDKILSKEKWLRIGRKLLVDLSGQQWRTARTATYNTIRPQIEHCKEKSIARVFSDYVGIGKTHTALVTTSTMVNSIYLNCKKYATRMPLVRAIAAEFGLESKGRYIDVRENLIANLVAMDRPHITLDDAGYLKDDAILEVISIWDDLQNLCGFYMIGEPAFKNRIEKMIIKNKLGWEAWFNRCGERILSVTDDGTEPEVALMKRTQCEQILDLNFPKATKEQRKTLLTNCKNNLRTLRDDISKMKGGIS